MSNIFFTVFLFFVIKTQLFMLVHSAFSNKVLVNVEMNINKDY